MKRGVLLVETVFISLISFSQGSDFILLKKKSKTVQTFFQGSFIQFQSAEGNFYSGKIDAIQTDSIYLTEYDIRQVPTNLGVYVLDTVAKYHFKVYYKNIIALGSAKSKNFNWAASGGSLFGGGILITAVGLGTWIFTKPGTQYHASPQLVIAGAVLGGIGYLLLKKSPAGLKLGNKYHLEYIKIKK